MKKCAVIIPALNPDTALLPYIDEVLGLDIGPVILINDGSISQTEHIFEKAAQKTNCHVLTHPQNQGKGSAIKTGIAYYKKTFSDLAGIITVDADGQHRIHDVQKLYNRLNQEPEALILGTRSFDKKVTPLRSRIGNMSISFGMRLLYNIRLKDTQTGLRAIPNSILTWIAELPGQRYDYELNMLIFAKKKAVPILTEPIETVYFDNNQASHYRTVADSARIFYHLSRAFVQYFLSSSISALADITIFTVFSQFLFASFPLAERILYATLIARLSSSIINYSVNRRLVYAQSKKLYPTMVKYYCLWSVQLTTSFLLVWLISSSGLNTVAAKIIVDLCLATISYQIQLRWVFKKTQV